MQRTYGMIPAVTAGIFSSLRLPRRSMHQLCAGVVTNLVFLFSAATAMAVLAAVVRPDNDD